MSEWVGTVWWPPGVTSPLPADSGILRRILHVLYTDCVRQCSGPMYVVSAGTKAPGSVETLPGSPPPEQLPAAPHSPLALCRTEWCSWSWETSSTGRCECRAGHVPDPTPLLPIPAAAPTPLLWHCRPSAGLG